MCGVDEVIGFVYQYVGVGQIVQCIECVGIYVWGWGLCIVGGQVVYVQVGMVCGYCVQFVDEIQCFVLVCLVQQVYLCRYVGCIELVQQCVYWCDVVVGGQQQQVLIGLWRQGYFVECLVQFEYFVQGCVVCQVLVDMVIVDCFYGDCQCVIGQLCGVVVVGQVVVVDFYVQIDVLVGGYFVEMVVWFQDQGDCVGIGCFMGDQLGVWVVQCLQWMQVIGLEVK